MTRNTTEDGMIERIVYEFEELTDDLPRPPLAALRAMSQAGLLVAPKGWQALAFDVRFELARAGLQGVVDWAAVRKLAERVPPKYIKLVPQVAEPNPDQVPEHLARALGPSRPLPDADWRAMRAVDRAVLASLAPNARLVALAYEEISVAMGKPREGSSEHWFGSVARCEIRLAPAAVNELTSPRFLDGRALLLARVAGIRAARRVTDVFDLHAEAGTGYVELDWRVSPRRDSILWQAHVSTWEGAFFPAASLLAVTTAASAVFDMIRQIDPTAHLKASVREEEWQVGTAASRLEEATSVYSASTLTAGEHGADPLQDKATVRMAPEDLPRPPLGELIAGSLAAPSPAAAVAPPSAPLVADPPARASSPSSARAPGAAPDRLRPSEPFVSAAPATAPAATPIPRTVVVLFLGAVFIFLLSVAMLAYVLVHA